MKENSEAKEDQVREKKRSGRLQQCSRPIIIDKSACVAAFPKFKGPEDTYLECNLLALHRRSVLRYNLGHISIKVWQPTLRRILRGCEWL